MLKLKYPSKCKTTLKGHESYINVVKFSNDSNYCISGSKDQSIILWNPFKSLLIKQYTGLHNGQVLDLAVTLDNSIIASVGGDKIVFVWDVETGKSIKRFAGHDARVNTVAFNKEDSVVVSGSYDGTVKFWDMKQSKNKCLDTINNFKDSVSKVIVSGYNIYAGGIDGYIRQIDLRAGEITSDYIGEAIVGMDITADKKSLIVSNLDNSVRLINLAIGDELSTYTGHSAENYMIGCKLSKDNSFFVTGSEDGDACVYHFLDAEPVGRLIGHKGCVTSVDVSRKNGEVLTGSHDGTLKLWN